MTPKEKFQKVLAQGRGANLYLAHITPATAPRWLSQGEANKWYVAQANKIEKALLKGRARLQRQIAAVDEILTRARKNHD